MTVGTRPPALRVAVVIGMAALMASLVPAPSGAVVPPLVPAMSLETFATGLASPLFLTHAGDDSGRVFVVEQRGRVQVFDASGNQGAQPYLDIASRVVCCGERGLLGLAFAPDFESSGRLYLSYTGSGGTSRLERVVVDDPASNAPVVLSTEIILSQSQPFSNHNGGMIAFGPDGMLYLGFGDGGSANDPFNAGQNTDNWLGAMLRLDVSGATGYMVPADNPFVYAPGLDEIWAYGLRNPWRFSFDRASGDLWIADVGQNLEEEVNWVSAASTGGENYGWQVYEGNQVHDATEAEPTDRLTMTFPVATYQHGFDCSVTGGYVYRGAQAPALVDMYLYADFCSGKIWHLIGKEGTYVSRLAVDTGHLVASFGEDEAGELYLVDLTGRIMRIVWQGDLV